MSKTLDQILTAEELERVQKDGLNANPIFATVINSIDGPVTLLGHKPEKHHDPVYLGNLLLVTAIDDRQIVMFTSPIVGKQARGLPRGYVVRHDHPSYGTSFIVRPFQSQKEDPFVMIHRVRYEENVSAREVELKALNMHGWAEWNISKEIKGSVNFDAEQWKHIWDELNNWLPKE